MEENTKRTDNPTKSSAIKRAFSIVAFIAIIIILGFAMIASKVEPKNSEKVWDPAMTVGNMDAKNYFIVYSDIMCPYCVSFENALFENEDKFEKYIEENDILLEVRLSDYLYEYGEARTINSRYSAEAAYCARNEGKFWDYYKIAITTIWKDYFRDNGKAAFSVLNAKDKTYWIDFGKKIGLGETFENCVNNDETLDEIIENAEKSYKLAKGMPYFKFNKFTTSGFSPNSDWNEVLLFFKAGLES